MSGWFYGTRAEPRGPVSSDEIRRLRSTGEITGKTSVWCPSDDVGPPPLEEAPFAAAGGPPPSTSWHYERGGVRVGPVAEAEMRGLLTAGDLTRDTLVWSPVVGSSFVPLGTTVLSAGLTAPPALPATRVDNTLAWLLAAVPLVAALLERSTGPLNSSPWGWPAAIFVVCSVLSLVDERRVSRSGNVIRSTRLTAWFWLIPVYLYQRARALRGPKYYVWAWVASFVASLLVATGDLTALFNGDSYLGIGIPACDSAWEQRQVRKVFDDMSEVKAAGLVSTGLMGTRELGSAGDLRTCVGQIAASDAQTYRVVFTVEARDDQIFTSIQLGK